MQTKTPANHHSKIKSMNNDNQGVYIEHEYICREQAKGNEAEQHININRHQTHPIRYNTPKEQNLLLDGPPPIMEVSQLNLPGAVEVYALLFESAYKTRDIDTRKDLPWSLREDTGATTEWSIKGMAKQLHLGKEKVGKAIDGLLDAGFIKVLYFVPTSRGSHKRVFQVVKYNQLENYRHSLEVMGEAYGKTTKKIANDSKGDEAGSDECDFLADDYDPGFQRLWDAGFKENVINRLEAFLSTAK